MVSKLFQPVNYIIKINVQLLVANTIYTSLLKANHNIIFVGYKDTKIPLITS